MDGLVVRVPDVERAAAALRDHALRDPQQWGLAARTAAGATGSTPLDDVLTDLAAAWSAFGGALEAVLAALGRRLTAAAGAYSGTERALVRSVTR